MPTYFRIVRKFRHFLVIAMVLSFLLTLAPAGGPWAPALAVGSNEVPAEDDSVPPEIISFTINHGDGITSLHEVTLQLDATDNRTTQNLLQIRFANEGEAWAQWEPYQGEREWLLPGGDGEKIVQVEVKDEAGNVAQASAAIAVLVPVTGVDLDWTSLTLEAGGDPVTLTATVFPEHATNRQVTWSSSNLEVVEVIDGVIIPVAVGEAAITVTTVDGGFTATSRVVVLSSLPPYDSPVIYGDVTGTGEVDVGDAIVVLRYIVGQVDLDERQLQAADVNLDGVVDVGDAIIILRHIVGLIPSLPVSYTPPGETEPPGEEDPPDEPLPPEPVAMVITGRLLNARYRVHTTVQVDVSILNVRSGPGIGYEKIGQIYQGQRFIIRDQAETGDSQYPLWYRINYYGQPGWIAANFVIALDVLYGLDYWSNETRLADAPEGLAPGDYKIDAQYQFHRQEGTSLVPTGFTFYFLEQIPYITMLLERPADPQVTASCLAQAAGQLRSDSPFPELAEAFIQAQETWGVNALYLMAHAALESAWGTSPIARDKNNIFGYMAFDSDPYGHAATFRSMEDSILQVSGYVRQAYLSEGGTWFHGPHLAGMNEKYATDPMWAVKIARTMQSLINYSNYAPVAKQLNRGVVTVSSLELRTGPSINDPAITTLAQNTQVEIVGMKLAGGVAWLKVISGSAAGWCSSEHLNLLTAPRGAVYFSTWYQPGNENLTLNVRTGPSLGDTIVDRLSFGAAVNIEKLKPVYDDQAGKWYVWYRVNYPGSSEGSWVRGDCVVVDW